MKKYYSNFKVRASIAVFFLIIIVGCKTGTMPQNNNQLEKITTFSLYKNQTENYFPRSKHLANLSNVEKEATQLLKAKSNKVLIIKSNRDYPSWRVCLKKNKGVQYFLIQPGDYRSWGVFEPTDSGVKTAKKALLYFDGQSRQVLEKEHPYDKKKKKKEVILESFVFNKVNFWTLHGISFRGKSNKRYNQVGGLPNNILDANFITINYCLIENINNGSGIRILNSSQNFIQNCLFQQTNFDLTTDNPAILVSAHTGKSCRNNKIVNNEIQNWNDGIALARHISAKNPQFNQTGPCPGTIIENNDIYLTPEVYITENGETFAYAENAIDNKQGTKSTNPKDKIQIINNRLWGFRNTKTSKGASGSPGAVIALHRDASNHLVKNNIIFDAPIGIMIFKNNPKFPDERVENIEVSDNVFYEIRKTSNFPYAGSVFYISRGTNIKSNVIIQSDKSITYKNPLNENHFSDNVLIDVQEDPPSCHPKWDLRSNNVRMNKKQVVGASIPRDFVFYVKRWTGPEKMVFKNIK